MTLARLAPLLLTLLTSVLAGGEHSLAASAPASGCAPGFVRPSPAALTRALDAAQARWKASGIHEYSYTFDHTAQPVRYPPTRIKVSGRKVRATPLTEGDPSVYAQKASIEGLYRFIRDGIAFARGEPCAELRVSYARDGHPLSFASQLQTPGTANGMADGGARWTVSGFRRR